MALYVYVEGKFSLDSRVGYLLLQHIYLCDNFSSLLAVTVADSHCARPWRVGEAELAWVA